jgi:hypothetical protein
MPIQGGLEIHKERLYGKWKLLRNLLNNLQSGRVGNMAKMPRFEK